jgi:hypothetical protein
MKTALYILWGLILAVGAYFLYTYISAPAPAPAKKKTNYAQGIADLEKRIATNGVQIGGTKTAKILNIK